MNNHPFFNIYADFFFFFLGNVVPVVDQFSSVLQSLLLPT